MVYVFCCELVLLCEFDDFSGTQSIFSFFFTALNFCFFCFKTKERTEKVYAFQTAVHPVGRQIHAVFVGSCSASVVAVESKEKSVVAVQPQVAVRAKAVEFLVGDGGDGCG